MISLQFLTEFESRAYLGEPDAYALKLPYSNLKLVNPLNPTLEGYQEILLNSFETFNQHDISIYQEYLKKLNDILMQEQLNINLNIKMIKTSGKHRLDIPHTRKDAILASFLLGYVTFVHEVYHVLSRNKPNLTKEFAKLFGFVLLEKDIVIDHPGFIANPDALVNNYCIDVNTNDGRKITAVPFIDETFHIHLQDIETGEYFSALETNYETLIGNTSYVAHLEEICAEYFALMMTGKCINVSKHNSLEKLETFKQLFKRIIS